MILAYNTNGLAHHELLDAIALVADIGFGGTSITLDHGALNPFDDRFHDQLKRVAESLHRHRLRCVIETGGRFLLDPRAKHEPTLVSPDPVSRQRRVDFLCRAIDIAANLHADCVSLWSGVVHDAAYEAETHQRLTEGLLPVLEHAERNSVDLAFEPEPGMAVDTPAAYEALVSRISAAGGSTLRLRLTLDIGHLHCQGELPIAQKIRQYAGRLANVHIEDMRPHVHEHLMFGEGTVDFQPVIAALAEIGYDGLLSVELSRHSHEGPTAARRAFDFLQPLLEAAKGA